MDGESMFPLQCMEEFFNSATHTPSYIDFPTEGDTYFACHRCLPIERDDVNDTGVFGMVCLQDYDETSLEQQAQARDWLAHACSASCKRAMHLQFSTSQDIRNADNM